MHGQIHDNREISVFDIVKLRSCRLAGGTNRFGDRMKIKNGCQILVVRGKSMEAVGDEKQKDEAIDHSVVSRTIVLG